jgi:hypothetical protein
MFDATRVFEVMPTSAEATRHWTGTDDDEFQHSALVSLAEDPLVLALSWRVSAAQPAAFVGCYRLHLRELLRADLVRLEGRGNVRLRFVHAGDGGVYVQRKPDAPRLLIGRV